MKFLIIFLSIIIGFVSANNISEDTDNAKIIAPQNILPIVEALMQNLKEDGKYDPLDLGERHFLIDDKNLDIKLDANIKGDVKGLLGDSNKFKKFDINLMSQFEFEFQSPEIIHLDISNYNVEGWLGLIKIFGDGKISVKVENTVIKASGALNRKTINGEKFALLKSIKLDININHITFEITGYLNDDVRSAYISRTLNSVVPILISQNKQKINTEIAKIIMKLSEGVLIPMPI